MKFNENPSIGGAEMFNADGRTHGEMDRRTNRHGEGNSRFSQLCECVHKLQLRK